MQFVEDQSNTQSWIDALEDSKQRRPAEAFQAQADLMVSQLMGREDGSNHINAWNSGSPQYVLGAMLVLSGLSHQLPIEVMSDCEVRGNIDDPEEALVEILSHYREGIESLKDYLLHEPCEPAPLAEPIGGIREYNSLAYSLKDMWFFAGIKRLDGLSVLSVLNVIQQEFSVSNLNIWWRENCRPREVTQSLIQSIGEEIDARLFKALQLGSVWVAEFGNKPCDPKKFIEWVKKRGYADERALEHLSIYIKSKNTKKDKIFTPERQHLFYFGWLSGRYVKEGLSGKYLVDDLTRSEMWDTLHEINPHLFKGSGKREPEPGDLNTPKDTNAVSDFLKLEENRIAKYVKPRSAPKNK